MRKFLIGLIHDVLLEFSKHVDSLIRLLKLQNLLNPFYSSVTFLYPLKTSENLWFSDVFRGYRNVTLD